MESRTFGRTIFRKWHPSTESEAPPVRFHLIGKPSFAALTVQLSGDQPNKPFPQSDRGSQKMGEGSAAGRQLGVDSVREHPATR
jgi:hypothetical protein